MYLKYKEKYLKQKQMGGMRELLMEKRFESAMEKIKIEMCVSYVTELIGSMENTIEAVRTNIQNIKPDNYVDGTNEKTIAQEIISNLSEISTLQIYDMNEDTDPELYVDLFNFKKLDLSNQHIIESEIRGGPDYVSRVIPREIGKFKNKLINLAANEGVHWIYVDSNANIHNPYIYNMQKNHSHQFCQTHSLLMALIPSTRTICSNLGPYAKQQRLCSYNLILALLNVIFPLVIHRALLTSNFKRTKKNTKVISTNALHFTIVNEIKQLNIDSEDQMYHKQIENFANNNLFLTVPSQITNATELAKLIHEQIITTLTTQKAYQIVPEFK